MTALTRFAPTIAALARPPALHAQGAAAQDLVQAFRLCALAARDRSDPLPALALRMSNCEAAYAVHDLVQVVIRVWPEPFVVGRACCQRLSPDEATLAQLADAGQRRDRDAFGAAIKGLIRADRHERLWDAFTHPLMLMR
ncbi:hypothetical protein [Novosphingobium sp. PASSN1]|uniref:hypothetical protein n=1 Tax=Novosphingobium sp. PASSN1 TaxID=2015561 RepID=UPI000BD786A6|nr:hypothetical protein [Novosphingobium sp. PASSN1]OYU33914.1 MAG: hypothetical protein CFE35_18055 [Novosphingobium sp. PASSN1]